MAEEKRKHEEVNALEDEAAKRRQRVALWQEQRRAAQAAEEAEMRKREEAAEKWTLDDDVEEGSGQVSEFTQQLIPFFKDPCWRSLGAHSNVLLLCVFRHVYVQSFSGGLHVSNTGMLLSSLALSGYGVSAHIL